jgi:hypothetical protein
MAMAESDQRDGRRRTRYRDSIRKLQGSIERYRQAIALHDHVKNGAVGWWELGVEERALILVNGTAHEAKHIAEAEEAIARWEQKLRALADTD